MVRFCVYSHREQSLETKLKGKARKQARPVAVAHKQNSKYVATFASSRKVARNSCPPPSERKYHLPRQILVEVPRERKFGDFSSNIALVLAKQVKANPRQLAAELQKTWQPQTPSPQLQQQDQASSIGLSQTQLGKKHSLKIIQADSNWIFRDLGQGKAVNVEICLCQSYGPANSRTRPRSPS